jgi:flagellar assembly factor FliW
MSSDSVTQEQRPAILISTVRLGAPETVPVEASSLYTFPDALPGLDDSHRYALIADAAYLPLQWLQSLDNGAVCLPVMDLSAIELGSLGEGIAQALTREEDKGRSAGRIMLVIRFDAAAEMFVVNLLAPIILDTRTGTGRQVILDKQSYPLRQPVRWDVSTHRFHLPC